MEEKKSDKKYQNSQNNSSLQRIGNFIREARLSRNQSIEELASDLKIGEHQLKAIEEGREDLLPEEVFIKAMVRRISEKLKIDTDFIMKEFGVKREEVKIEDIVQEVSNKKDTYKSQKGNFSFGFGIFILISGVFGLLASTFIFNMLTDSFQNQNNKQEVIKKN